MAKTQPWVAFMNSRYCVTLNGKAYDPVVLDILHGYSEKDRVDNLLAI